MSDLPNLPYNTLIRHTRSSYAVVDGVTVPLSGSPMLPGQTAPVTYLLAQRALAQTVDLTHDTPGHAFLHTRTANILAHTLTPPAVGSTLPISSQMPLVLSAAFSSVTDMQLYALDVGSTDGLLFSQF